jgi:hypothetical protein
VIAPDLRRADLLAEVEASRPQVALATFHLRLEA